MKLTDVARASLSELRGDYEIFIIDRGELPWSAKDSEAQTVKAISIDNAPFIEDVVHESVKHPLEQRRRRSAKGDFWGCTGYPDYRGTKEI